MGFLSCPTALVPTKKTELMACSPHPHPHMDNRCPPSVRQFNSSCRGIFYQTGTSQESTHTVLQGQGPGFMKREGILLLLLYFRLKKPRRREGQHSGQQAWASPEGRGLFFLGVKACSVIQGDQMGDSRRPKLIGLCFLHHHPMRNSVCLCGCYFFGGKGDTNVTVSLWWILCAANFSTQ